MHDHQQKLALSPWMDADAAVVYLQFRTRKALYQAVRRGQVPVHRLGQRRMRFHRAELDKLLSERR
jgi:excisionase family DNA binding protein